MEEAKKRKLNPSDDSSLLPSQEDLKKLLEPLRKDQLIDLLVKLGSQYTTVAEEIKSVASADPIHRKLFVRGLSWDTTSATLCDAFRVHGEIDEGAVITDKVTGKSRGYGFITYKSLESTLSALREPSKLIDGRMVACNLACEGLSGGTGTATTDQSQRKLYIGGLSPDISSETLLHFFGRHGEIEEGSVAYEKDTNKSRGFGFVTYKTAEAARKAMDDPNKIFGGRNITVKLADTQKNKNIQTPIPAGMIPFPVPIYAQPGKAHVNPPVAYSPYPQVLATYPHTAFPNHAPASPYPPHTQMSYAPFPIKNDHVGLPAGSPAGIGGYPYYMGNQ